LAQILKSAKSNQKTMLSTKKYIIPFILGLTLFLSSCTVDDDDGIEEDPRLKFGGTWIANETSSVFGTSAYQVTVSNDPNNTSQIQIANFYNLGAGSRVNAIVAGNSLNITNQSVSGQTISGSGTFINDGFRTTFDANDGQITDNVTVQYSKP